MVFSSFSFLGLFLPLMMIAYFASVLLFRNIRIANRILLIGSLFFYAWGEPAYVVLLIGIALSDYLIGKKIGATAHPGQRKRMLLISIAIDLGALAFFKYSGFIVQNIYSLLGMAVPSLSIRLPIGISFYVFQSLSYIFDVYADKVQAEEKFPDYLLYLSLFPQLIAGPIVRYRDIAEQIHERHTTLSGFARGTTRFCAGLCKKIVFANQFGAAAATLLDQDLSHISMAASWLGALLFAMQIYFDFSGYSDMAVGLGHIFGFTYKENFNYPYIARSITDFWRRWHISLSSFFRDYVYIPLGGNRRLQVRNMLIVWLLTGLWHGASWNFVLWGLYYGAFLIVEKWADRKDLTLPGPIAWSVSMMIVLFGWGIFYYTDFTRLIQFTKGFFCVNGLYASQYMKMVTVWYQSFWLLVAGILAATPLPRNLYHKYIACRKPLAILWNSAVTGCALYLCFIFLVGESYNPFLYFRF